jgi:hypothetical protein
MYFASTMRIEENHNYSVIDAFTRGMDATSMSGFKLSLSLIHGILYILPYSCGRIGAYLIFSIVL